MVGYSKGSILAGDYCNALSTCYCQLVTVNVSLSACHCQLVTVNLSLSTCHCQLVTVNLSLSTVPVTLAFLVITSHLGVLWSNEKGADFS